MRAWSIDTARTEANRLRVMFDGGTDPREAERQQNTDKALKAIAAAAHAVTVGEVWAAYLEARRPHWGERPTVTIWRLRKLAACLPCVAPVAWA